MTHSDYLEGFLPVQPNAFARPVQFESAVVGPLNGAELPDGTGCLVWANGGDIRFAHTPDVDSWLVDSSVTMGMAATAVATGGSVTGTSVFVAEDELYLIAYYSAPGSINTLELYQADSATLPTSWSLKSTLWSSYAPGGSFGNPDGTGHPLILDTGRWVLPCKTSEVIGGSFQATNMRVFTTDNQGTSWTLRYLYTHPYPGFPRIEFLGPHIGTDPATGNLWFMSGTTITGPEHQIALHRSTDNGTSWGIIHSSAYPYTNPHPIPFLNNGNELWAIDETYYVFRSYLTGSDGFPDNTNWPSSGISWVAPGITTDSTGAQRQRGIIAPQANAVFFFVRDQVMRIDIAQPGWVFGAAPMGESVSSGWQ